MCAMSAYYSVFLYLSNKHREKSARKLKAMLECAFSMRSTLMGQQNDTLWSSRAGFILATTGAAVGLGNLWRFPYVAGTHGGGTFVILYRICVLLIGIPIMFAEMHIGKLTQNPVDALKTLSSKANSQSPWHLLGYWGAVGLILVLSFYSVVAGWAFHYFGWALTHDFSHVTPTSGIKLERTSTVAQHYDDLAQSIFRIKRPYCFSRSAVRSRA